jgi:hypothetical protein
MQAALIAILACTVQGPDRVTLREGGVLRGRVVFDDGETLVVRSGAREREVARAEVSECVSLLAHWREMMTRWLSGRADDPVFALDLAVYCRRTGLAGEAEVLALHALALDPERRGAREALGHELAPAGWTAPRGKKRVPWAQIERERADFGSAWELSTLHWRLRTNLPLRQAAATALDLECAYAAFHELVGPLVGRLLDADPPLVAHVHADSASFPEIGRSRGWYDPASGILRVDASAGLDRGLVVHEAVHQLLDSAARRGRTSRGDIPAWLDEGLAEHLRATLAGPPGRFVRTAGTLDRTALRAFALAREPYALDRLLRMGPEDFLASSRSDLKYAQAYALVSFLHEGDGGRWHPGFGTYLRSAWGGQGGPQELERALGAELPAIERGWRAWVTERGR